MRIKTFNKIADEGLAVLENRIPTSCVGPQTESPDAIILRSHKLQVEECSGVVAVARAGAGVNNVPVSDLTESGVVVFNTPGANANAVAELTIASMIAEARNMDNARKYFDQESDGTPLAQAVERDKKQFKGTELRGSKLAVVGLGAIGSAVVQLAKAFGMQVIGYDPYQESPPCRVTSDLGELLENAKYITFHVPPTEDTKRLALDVLMRLGPGADVVILNFSRAEVFSGSDLLHILGSKDSVRRYITDFPNDEIINDPKVVAYPHIGASTTEAEDNCATMAAEQLCDFWEYGAIKNSVNFPEMPLVPYQASLRLLFLHRNEPGKLKEITTRLADLGANVVAMTNRAKGDYAATLVDFEARTPKETLTALEEIDTLRVFKVAVRPL